MRNRIVGAAAVLVTLLLAAPACKHKGARNAESSRMASVVRMSDPTKANQLVNGFYGLEAGAWRWTARQFAVNLRPPAQTGTPGGCVVDLRLTIPANTIQQLGSLTLSGTVGGFPLPPETYTKAGAYDYRRFLPANLVTGESVRVDFQLDKVMPPGDADKRELGIVVSSVGLAPR